ncbi:MAG: hypothetical protein HZY76_00780 [Anaerolineae bacterium]|nr:MAG: hypothetical protein HZY76_00780 [Anaerolineae bacterium]
MIEQVGTPGATNSSTAADGVEIQGAGQRGVRGLCRRRRSACAPGRNASQHRRCLQRHQRIEIVSTQGYGVYISRSDADGMRVGLAGDDGIDVAGSDLAGYFAGPITVGSCTGCLLAAFAVNAGDRPLQPGDIVTVRGMAVGAFDNAASLWQVTPAGAGLPIVGVVAGWAEVDVKPEPRGESGVRLVPREGGRPATTSRSSTTARFRSGRRGGRG